MSGALHDRILGGLNPPQREAAARIDGPLLVLAGAGSGKTRVITRRIAWMIEQGIEPASILAVTFTNKAAREMRERVRALTGRYEVRLSTFHSFCAAFLRHEFPSIGRASDFSIYDDADGVAVVRQILEELGLESDKNKPNAYLEQISSWKNTFVLPDTALERAQGTKERDQANVYDAYDLRLRESNACDFDDLLVQAGLLLRDHPDVLARWQERITHVLVDEFQDTNRIQYDLVRLLAARTGNLCVTGDQDQSIYSWRGADVENFDRFLLDHPGAAIVKLEQNYRSSGAILRAASSVIAHNRHRIPKRLWTDADEGEPVRVVGFSDDYEEALSVVAEIRRLLAAGTPPSEIAVLYRTNALSLPIERTLVQAGVPYRVYGGLEFFGRTEVKDLLAWLRFLVNPADTVSLARILNAPPRGIGEGTRARIEEFARSQKRAIGQVFRDRAAFASLPGRARKALDGFADLLEQLDYEVHHKALDVESTIRRILEASGFAKHWGEKASKNGALDPYQNLGQLVNLARDFDRVRQGTLAEFLADIALLTDLERRLEGEEPVALMSLHSSKGLEFEAVFLIGADAEVLPHRVSREAREGEEEERRLLHVGMTRAKRHLVVTWAARRNRFGQSTPSGPSKFLDELGSEGVEHYGEAVHGWGARGSRRGWQQDAAIDDPSPMPAEIDADQLFGEDTEELERFRTGARVRHPEYGEGVVSAVRGRARGLDTKVVVTFEDGATRTLVLRHARLDLLES